MYRVDVTHTKDLVFSIKSGDCEFVMDAKGNGLTPPSALLASLGSCIGVYMRKYAEGSSFKLDNFNISLEAEFTREPALAFRAIKVTIDLKDAKIDDRRKQAILEFIKHCPVHNTLKANPAVEVQIS